MMDWCVVVVEVAEECDGMLGGDVLVFVEFE